jgi:hypothetical protein
MESAPTSSTSRMLSVFGGALFTAVASASSPRCDRRRSAPSTRCFRYSATAFSAESIWPNNCVRELRGSSRRSRARDRRGAMGECRGVLLEIVRRQHVIRSCYEGFKESPCCPRRKAQQSRVIIGHRDMTGDERRLAGPARECRRHHPEHRERKRQRPCRGAHNFRNN